MDADVRRARLDAALGKAMAEVGTMQWGKDDCALWCADILHAALGYDAAVGFRGRYGTSDGAQEVLGKGGLPAALRAAARTWRWRRVDPDQARVGDIGLAALGDTVSTAICRGRIGDNNWFVARSELGWTSLPARLIRLAWTVVP